MQMPQIRLDSQFARIGIQTTNTRTETQQPQADLSIQQPKADLTIETTPSKLTIDQTEAWADMDLKHISRRIEEAAQQGKQDLLEGIARRAQQGDELMKIENSGNPLAEQAKTNSVNPMKEFNIGFIPSAGSVKIQFEPAKVNIDVKRNEPIIESKPNKPIVDYYPGKVDINLIQRNELEIDFINVDIKA
ncbi:DUF6470 family protein [Metabacillus fastidiosus]|uniref:DUF6470 family protein n=1 Tax=Metabacillus fastidiosus TaxID=1458 RepID=A0ABU6P065_9BACI|nr:DUF6470 family protein [Metabacillus fastidiosus]MED4402757.1 DUF6470 family protein [Metabacillus fastidiosus]MED4461184.1 DUF6470 family protein [Metabacillus fastidiosus]